jgi:dynein heavy chain
VFEITPSRGYNETNFKEDLKKLYKLVGVDGKHTVFLLKASQATDEGKYLFFLFFLL